MKNKDYPIISFRVSDDFKRGIQNRATNQNLTLSKFIKLVLQKEFLTNRQLETFLKSA